jgi:orotate phosphoribosyltransferase
VEGPQRPAPGPTRRPGDAPPESAAATRQRLLELLLERSFRVGEFVLASGQRSTYYVDGRTTTMHAEGQYLIGRLGLASLEQAALAPDSIGGLTMGADPIAYAIAHASWRAGSPIHAFSVRKEAKLHGAGRQIEGCFEPGHRVVVVEDTITSGSSALRACRAIEAAGGEVLAVLALVDREESGGRKAIEMAGYPVLALFRARELLDAVGSVSDLPDTP